MKRQTYRQTDRQTIEQLGRTIRLRGRVSEKSTFFKELTPRSRTYELRGQGKRCTKSRQTNTSHCPTKTISKTETHPLKKIL